MTVVPGSAKSQQRMESKVTSHPKLIGDEPVEKTLFLYLMRIELKDNSLPANSIIQTKLVSSNISIQGTDMQLKLKVQFTLCVFCFCHFSAALSSLCM